MDDAVRIFVRRGSRERDLERLRVRDRARPFGQANQQRKIRARAAVQRALETGALKRQPCEVCGRRRTVQAHHDDYDKPLDVRWLCSEHHADEREG